MGAILKEIEAQALQLPPKEHGDLIHSFDRQPRS